jgi:hypothetical protein
MVPRMKQPAKIFKNETESKKFAQHHGIIKDLKPCPKDGSG